VVLRLGRLVTVSAKVDEKLRKRARRLGVNISEVVRKALEEEVRRAELRELVKLFAGELDSSPRLPEGTVVEIIREMRRGSVAEGW
jgi:antitoxin CcdA